MPFDPISWALGFTVNKIANSLIGRIFSNDLTSKLNKVVKVWADEVSETAYIHPDALFPNIQSEISQSERPHLYALRESLQAGSIPTIEQWNDALMEQWTYIRSQFKIEDRQEFFNQKEPDAKKQINGLAHSLVKAYKEDREHFQVTTYDDLKEIKGDVKELLDQQYKKTSIHLSIIKSAANKDFEQWKKEYSFVTDQFIEPNLYYNSINVRKRVSIKEICDFLQNGKPIVLKGVPGIGKTITLLQIAEQLLYGDNHIIPLLISLPSWASEGQNILSYIEGRLTYKAENINSHQLATVVRDGHIVFLLNGWNEIPQGFIDKAQLTLRSVIGLTGLVITTRENLVSPPIQNHLEIHIDPITKIQRKFLIEKSLAKGTVELATQIERNKTLEKITRIPFFLSAILKLARRKKDIGLLSERYEILCNIIKEAEERVEHNSYLFSKPLYGYHKEYLMNIAMLMTKLGSTALHIRQTIKEINETSLNLLKERLITDSPNPNDVLNLLINHHLLVHSISSSSPVRFVHQQFQEWFASEKLYHRLHKVCKSNDPEETFKFKEEIIDRPVWEEAVFFLAERISTLTKNDEKWIEYGSCFVHWAMAPMAT